MSADQLNVTHIARSFVAARRAGTVLAVYPGTAPAALDEAYRVQDEAIALVARSVAGWKVGKIAPPVDGVDRLAGPIFADQVVHEQADPVPMPVFAGGFAAAEAEFLLRIGVAPHPAQKRFTIDEARALVDAVHVGIEIASSPYPGINDDGPAVTVSDFGNHNGLVVGRAIEDWHEVDLDSWPVSLLVNGDTVGEATTATMLDGPFGAVRFLLELAARRGIALTAGQWVSTGAVTGVHAVAIGDRVEARFGDGYTLGCTIKAH